MAWLLVNLEREEIMLRAYIYRYDGHPTVVIAHNRLEADEELEKARGRIDREIYQYSLTNGPTVSNASVEDHDLVVGLLA